MEQILPQLQMEKSDLDNVPDVPLPEAYFLRCFQNGDEAGLAKVYRNEQLGMITATDVRKTMLEHQCFKPERLFVVVHDDVVVGTAAAWVEPCDPAEAGRLHMLAVAPQHRGMRLGTRLTIETIKYTRNEGFAVQRLSTDDWREPAIRVYLRLGYYPLLIHESHRARWEAIAAKLNVPDPLARARVPEQ
jgi:mycothiol synthase